ncbi:hypothetical protein GJ496_003998 [Pomphorhynchus laevis]|nr:hypothetical protein GJ496_003998 [Pomphorhynchus laevis]
MGQSDFHELLSRINQQDENRSISTHEMVKAVGESQRTDAEVGDDDHIDDVIDLDESSRKNDSRSNVNQDAAHNGNGEYVELFIKHHHDSSN